MEEVTPVEERWARGWIKGISTVLATGGVDETPEEFKKEVEAIEKIGTEKGAKVYEYAKRWRQRLIEVIGKE